MTAWVIECTSTKKFNPLARFIMWKQKTNFSHMAVLISEQNAVTIVYHASWPFAERLTLEQFLDHYKIVNIYALKQPEYATWSELVGLLHSIIDSHAYYSVTQLILIYLRQRYSLLKSALKMAILNHEKGLICSELVARFLNKGWRIVFESGFDSVDLIETSEKARSVRDESKIWPAYL